MRFQKTFAVLMAMLCPFILSAQELKVLKVEEQQQDLTARTHPRQDLNGELCALLKVSVPSVKGMKFSGSIVGSISLSGGVYSIYVPEGTKRISFRHDDYFPGEIDFASHGISIKGGMVYSINIAAQQATPASAAEDWQLLVLDVVPKTASVELDGASVAVRDGVAQKLAIVGSTVHYRVSAPGMVTKEGDMLVGSEKTKRHVVLERDGLEVSIKAPDDVEIWINGEIASYGGSWKGRLVEDHYLVEARVGGAVVGRNVIEVSGSNAKRDFEVKIDYGAVLVSSNVARAYITMDGQPIGEAPVYIPQVMPGNHIFSASNPGMPIQQKTVRVESGEKSEVSLDFDIASTQSQKAESAFLEHKEDDFVEEAIPFQLVETKPSFQGGDANSFSKWVTSHLIYPEEAKDKDIQGRVVLQFTVGVDGSVSNVKVLRGVHPLLDYEAVRVVSQSPLWTPGTQRDRKVRVTYTFPVIFQLTAASKDSK